MVSLLRSTVGALVTALALGGVAVLAACTSIANVDLSYTDAGDATDIGSEASTAADGGPSSAADATILPQQEDAQTSTAVACQGADGSSCDQTQGLGCCVPPAGGTPFCSDLQNAPTTCGGGLFMACERTDQTSESECCWNGNGPGAFTAYAASCGARSLACTSNLDCPIGTPCNTVHCRGLAIGACGTTPRCP